jgi:hypothetical protein
MASPNSGEKSTCATFDCSLSACKQLGHFRRRDRNLDATAIDDILDDDKDLSRRVCPALSGPVVRAGPGGGNDANCTCQWPGRVVCHFKEGLSGSIQRRRTGFRDDDTRPPDTAGACILGGRSDLAWTLLLYTRLLRIAPDGPSRPTGTTQLWRDRSKESLRAGHRLHKYCWFTRV